MKTFAWEQRKLGDVAEIKHGYAFKGEHFSSEPTSHLLITPGNFAIGGGFLESPKYYDGIIPEEYVLKKNDLVVTMTDLSKKGDTLGYPALIPSSNRYLHNQRIGLVTIRGESVLKDYVYWLMRTDNYQRFIVSAAGGSTVRHTSPNTILTYSFHLPSTSEQRKIGSFLSDVDNLITLHQRKS